MLPIHTIQSISLQRGDGRNLRYVLQLKDPMANDPFIILADDKFAHNTFADHPHKGMQTVTHVLEGSLTHYDSKTGTGGKLSEGDFQIMTAGRGIIHNENPDRGEEVRVLQLWVNLSPENKKTTRQLSRFTKRKSACKNNRWWSNHCIRWRSRRHSFTARTAYTIRLCRSKT